MRKTLLVLTAVSLAALVPAAQASASKQEKIGVGAGAIVGGAAGGPVGVIVGAAIGAALGDRMHSKDNEIEALSGSLHASRTRVSSLELDVTTFTTVNVGENTVTLTVTDNNGNESTAKSTVTVEDNVPPEVVRLTAGPAGGVPVYSSNGSTAGPVGLRATSTV